ncbi:uncharacterized protein [Diadema antillarum]|uniref:uncharacterized protein n=1 Tax=Diadema antillarum TaxID=105358 RepID=UPI003A8ADF33
MIVERVAILASTLAVICVLTSALTTDEIAAFGARNFTDQNTGLQGYITISESDDDNYVVEANGIPDHEAGPYPNSEDPSEIIEQTYVYYILKTPTPAPEDEKEELPMGTIALTLNGVPLFNPYTAIGTDAVENEIFDDCDGHPTPEHGAYHYHSRPKCVFTLEEGVPSGIVGVALDGYPIYGNNDENGNELMTADLDACHGRTVDGSYRYHITADFPYILGCFHGVVDERNLMSGGGPGDRPPRPGDDPGDNPGDNPGTNDGGGDDGTEAPRHGGRAPANAANAVFCLFVTILTAAIIHFR